MKKCFYSVLGVRREATFSEIKKSYRKLVVKYHPDRNNGSKECEEKIKEINEAYEHLSDSHKRAVYNERYNTSSSYYSAPPPKRKTTQQQVVHDVRITLEESFFGCTKQINIVDNHGQERVYTVTIPRGVDSGQTLVVPGNAYVTDFFIKVLVSQHSVYDRRGCDLFCTVTVPYIMFLDGGVTDLPWFDGVYKLNLRKGVNSNTTIPLQNMGMPIPGTNSFGTLYVSIRIRGLVDFSSAILEESMCGV